MASDTIYSKANPIMVISIISQYLRIRHTRFQEIAGLAKTGSLDEGTRKKMASPRCGMLDAPQELRTGRKWKHKHITYSFESWTQDLDKETVRKAISEAFGAWGEVSALTFEEVPQGTGDIKIKFGSGNHGDSWPFDGEGGVLAHATQPEVGWLHFDEDEKWTYREGVLEGDNLKDLTAVAMHEVGLKGNNAHFPNQRDLYQLTSPTNRFYRHSRRGLTLPMAKDRKGRRGRVSFQRGQRRDE
ncbi:hypothetical protein WR25_11764 [Diploscapter pachys]|uniref:Peptidase metallopeptidase domain-containing protein n=1 Tax=Diploscapter pachys TaxID=2018661 RepID=A0A2A2JWY7_9BILA|nr:hypothetical protein WR25_11764 [Diploscapter pachys]